MICGVIVSEKLATLNELQTIYSLGDLYIMYDIIATDRANESLINNKED